MSYLIELYIDGDRAISAESFAELRLKLVEVEKSIAQADHLDRILEQKMAEMRYWPPRRTTKRARKPVWA